MIEMPSSMHKAYIFFVTMHLLFEAHALKETVSFLCVNFLSVSMNLLLILKSF
jgi:hypothetical protein